MFVSTMSTKQNLAKKVRDTGNEGGKSINY